MFFARYFAFPEPYLDRKSHYSCCFLAIQELFRSRHQLAKRRNFCIFRIFGRPRYNYCRFRAFYKFRYNFEKWFFTFFYCFAWRKQFLRFLDQNACMQFCVPLFSISLFCCHFCGSKGRQQKSKNDLQVLSKPKINSAPSSAPFSGHHLLLEIQKSN